MVEKSGIEMIKEIMLRLEKMEQQLLVVDQNIKKIANSAKIIELAGKSIPTNKKPKAEAVNVNEKDKMRFNFQTSSPPKAKAQAVAAEAPNTIMCRGKMVVETAEGSTPLADLSVKIYNSHDKLIKETKTNRGGIWMGQLPPGQYVVCYEGEFKGQALVPVNKNFEVPIKLPKNKTFIEVN